MKHNREQVNVSKIEVQSTLLITRPPSQALSVKLSTNERLREHPASPSLVGTHCVVTRTIIKTRIPYVNLCQIISRTFFFLNHT